jgi:hypothetical protein
MGIRRQRKTRTRAATALLIAALLLFAAALSACGAAGPQPAETTPAAGGTTAGASTGPPASEAASSPSPAASVTAESPAASPSPEPTPEPPLDKPSKKDPMRVYFGGDSLSGMPGMWLGILRKKDGLAKVKADYVESSRLTWEEPVDWPSRVRQQMSSGRWDVGVFMIGANDSGMPMIVAGGKSAMYPKKAWLEEYESRAKRIATIMLRAGVKRVYWVGMPVMPSSSESKKMRDLNEIFESVAASSPDIEYVDSYDLLSTKGGKIDGSLRSGDGVHYTDEGAQTVAKAVWKAIRQDWGGR